MFVKLNGEEIHSTATNGTRTPVRLFNCPCRQQYKEGPSLLIFDNCCSLILSSSDPASCGVYGSACVRLQSSNDADGRRRELAVGCWRLMPETSGFRSRHIHSHCNTHLACAVVRRENAKITCYTNTVTLCSLTRN